MSNMKTNKKTLILTSVVILLPILIGILLWNKLPDSMAVHFNFDNEADGYREKWFAVIIEPFILLALHLIMAMIIAADPRKKNISSRVYGITIWIIPASSLALAVVIYPYNLGIHFNISLFLGIFLGVIYIIVGNYLPKTRQNYTIGFKLPWTYANEENWNKTNRLAGVIDIVMGILIIINAAMGVLNIFYSFLAAVLIGTLIPLGYSYFLHVKKNL
ncbi:MAG: SdpI family protein [[Eubacterium] sulci]|nr:SdpI family protein [[Eubacterium] sulci]